MNVLVEEKCLKDIAESIRKKSGVTTTYKPREMAVAIDGLEIRYLVTIDQLKNQVITATCNGKEYTKSFMVYGGDKVTFSIKSEEGYQAGKLNLTEVVVKEDITVNATPPIRKISSPYLNQIFYIYEGTAAIKYCKFKAINESFRINVGSSGVSVSSNDKLQQLLENNSGIYFDYNGESVATFDKSNKAVTYNYDALRDFKSGTELTIKVVES